MIPSAAHNDIDLNQCEVEIPTQSSSKSICINTTIPVTLTKVSPKTPNNLQGWPSARENNLGRRNYQPFLGEIDVILLEDYSSATTRN
jgi:hypothetical protein